MRNSSSIESRRNCRKHTAVSIQFLAFPVSLVFIFEHIYIFETLHSTIIYLYLTDSMLIFFLTHHAAIYFTIFVKTG